MLQDEYRRLYKQFLDANFEDKSIHRAAEKDPPPAGAFLSETTASTSEESEIAPVDPATAVVSAAVTATNTRQPGQFPAKSKVQALLEDEVASIEKQVQGGSTITRSELLGRDRFGRGYYLFHVVNGVLIEPLPTPISLTDAGEQYTDTAEELTEHRLRYLSAFGFPSLAEFPASIKVYMINYLRHVSDASLFSESNEATPSICEFAGTLDARGER